MSKKVGLLIGGAVLLGGLFFVMLSQNRSPKVENTPVQGETQEIAQTDKVSDMNNPASDPDKDPALPGSVSQDGSSRHARDGRSGEKGKKLTVKNQKKLVEPKEGEFFLSPVWSLDGQVLYTGAKYSGLYKYDPLTGKTIQISDMEGIGFGAEMLPDGSIKTQKGIIDPDGVFKEGVPEDPNFSVKDDVIYLKQEDGSLQQLTTGSDNYFNPNMSPDGTKVAYQGLVGGVYIKDLNTGEVYNLGQGTNPVWLPDSSGILYAYSEDDGYNLTAGEIYYASADGASNHDVTGTPDTIEQNPSLSPDGTQILWNDENGNVYVGDLSDF